MSNNFSDTETRKHVNGLRVYAFTRSEKENLSETEDAILPLIPDGFYKDIHSSLKAVVEQAASMAERDILLIGSMVCFSAMFDNVSSIYDSRKVYPNLYFFVSAPPGVGKGSLNFCREIIAPLHRKLREEARQEMVEYKKACKENVKNGISELPEEPKMKMFLIPANSSAASFQKILADNDGKGLMFETEGDTLSQTLKRDYGQYSDILRKAFHHEPVTMSRKANREYLEVSEPKLSVILAGTPKQVQNLIPNAESGLMSRFMFYNLPFTLETRKVFDPNGSEKFEHFKDIGEKVCKEIELFKKQGDFSFKIREDCQEIFYGILRELTEECVSIDENLLGTAHRMGLIGFRIMMILTILRELDEHKVDEQPFDGKAIQLVCSMEDFGRTIMLMNVLTQHAIYMFHKLSSFDGTLESKKDKRRYIIFDQMPSSFTKHDYNVIVEKQGFNIRTSETWLNQLIAEGKLQRTSQGVYKKKLP